MSRSAARLGALARDAPGLLVLGIALGAIGPIAFVQRRGMLLLLILATLGLLIANRRAALHSLRWPILWAIGAFSVWLVLSLAWSQTPRPGLVVGVLAALLMGVAAVACARRLQEPHQRRLIVTLVASVWVLTALLLVDAAMSARLTLALPGRGDPAQAEIAAMLSARGAPILATLVWIAAAVTLADIGRLWIAAALVAFSAAAVFAQSSGPAQFAFVAGFAAVAAAGIVPRATVVVLFAGYGAYAVFAPWLSRFLVTPDRLMEAGFTNLFAGLHTIGVWNRATDWIVDAPFTGLGFGGSRWMTGMNKTFTLPQDAATSLPVMPLHPHNGVIQLWLETGAVGIVIFLAGWLALFFSAYWRAGYRIGAMAIAGTLAAALTLSTLSVSLWSEWWVATIMLAGVMMRLFFPVPGAPARPVSS